MIQMVPSNDHLGLDHHVPRKERWLDIVKKSDCKTSGAMAQDGILGSHSLVISVWTGRCCLYPQETRVCQVSHKVKAKDPYNTAGHGNELQVGSRGYSYLQHNLTSIWEAEGTWYPAFRRCRTSPPVDVRTRACP